MRLEEVPKFEASVRWSKLKCL